MHDTKLRYLVIDDDPGDIEILGRLLACISAGRAEVATFTASEPALAELESNDFDLIFIDYMLGKETGLDVFQAIRDIGCDRPVIMFTGQGSEAIAVEAMKAGVADYVVKEHLEESALERVMANALIKFELEQQLKKQQEHLAQKVQELQEALDLIETLQGNLSICLSCKKVKNNEGRWEKIESYITRNSEAVIIHSLCPDCRRKSYPNLDEDANA